MIHKVFLSEIDKKKPDINTISQLLQQGRKLPWSISNMFSTTYEKIGLNDTIEKGVTIFHLLGSKGLLGKLVSTIFSNAVSILERENIGYKLGKQSKEEAAQIKMLNLLHSKADNGLTSIEMAMEVGDDGLVNYLLDLALNNSNFAIGIVSLADYLVNKSQKSNDKLDKLVDANYLKILVEANHPYAMKVLNKLLYLIKKQTKDKCNITSNEMKDILGVDKISEEKYQELLPYFSLNIEQLRKLSAEKNDSQMSQNELIEKVKHQAIINTIRFALNKKNEPKDLDIEKIFPNIGEILSNKGQVTFLDSFIKDELIVATEIIKELNQEEINKVVEIEVPKILKDQNLLQVEKIIERNITTIETPIEEVKGSNKENIDTKKQTVILPKIVEKKIGGSDHLDSIKKFINKKYLPAIKEGLGEKYNDLQFFIYINAKYEGQFNKILDQAAKELKSSRITLDQYIEAVIDQSKAEDLNFIGSKNKTALDIACIKNQIKWIEAILKKGVELKIYDQSTTSIYKEVIEDPSAAKALEYLLSTQKIIDINWDDILFDAVKYGNKKAVRYYVSSEAGVVTKCVNRSKEEQEEIIKKYSLLNYGIDRLTHVAELRFHCKSNEREQKEKLAMDKMLDIADCLILLIDSKKVHCNESPEVIKKTIQLLYMVSKYITGFEKQSKKTSEFKSEVIEKFEAITKVFTELNKKVVKFYQEESSSSEIQKEFSRIAEGYYPDNQSDNGSMISGYSVFSQFYKPEEINLAGHLEGDDE